MWEYSDKEYVKVFRKMLRWEWYTDTNTKALFLHCLLKANWKDTRWKGIEIKRGQFVTSLSSLSKETGLSIQEVRTALNHLKSTGEVTDRATRKYRIITVLFYDDYQTANKQSNKQLTNSQQTANKQPTTDIRTYKNREEQEEEKDALLAPPGWVAEFGDDDTDDEEGWGFD